MVYREIYARNRQQNVYSETREYSSIRRCLVEQQVDFDNGSIENGAARYKSGGGDKARAKLG